MLSVAVLSNAAGDISDVAVLSSSNTLFAKFDKLLNIRPDAPGPVFLGFGIFCFFGSGAFFGLGADVLLLGDGFRAGGAGRGADLVALGAAEGAT
jgi:hypothetical protein